MPVGTVDYITLCRLASWLGLLLALSWLVLGYSSPNPDEWPMRIVYLLNAVAVGSGYAFSKLDAATKNAAGFKFLSLCRLPMAFYIFISILGGRFLSTPVVLLLIGLTLALHAYLLLRDASGDKTELRQ